MPRDSKSRNGLAANVVDLALKGKLVPGSYSDGRGLLLKVDKGSARWVLRIMIGGKRRDLGLGSVQHVGLADARERAAAKVKEVRAGKEPTRVKALTFREAAKAVYELRKADWKEGSKHVDEWWDQLENHILPALGSKLVGDIEPSDMYEALKPHWNQIEETARRLRQRCELVFDWATVKGYRAANLGNPASICVAALPKQTDETAPHPAVMWKEAPTFVEALRDSKAREGARLCLEFTLLTACRTAEALYAEWSEMDLEGRTWTVPAGRMKRGKEHRVALSMEAIAVLETAKAKWPNSRVVFNGRWPGEPLSNQAMLMLMRRLAFKDHDGRVAVPHGCRATFRSWAADHQLDDKACELALSHQVGTKVSRSYDRSDLLDPRRAIMQAWADFCTGKEVEKAMEAA
jgi:integrase